MNGHFFASFSPVRLVGALAILVLCLLSLPVFAHTHLEETTPKADAVLEKAPSQLVLRYGDPVNLVKLDLTRQGVAVALEFKPTTRPIAEYEIPLPSLTPGQYQVEWRALGADGHLLQGKWQFQIQ
ncbi:copper resistance CopC family protein [Gilvimarinus sp. F26214L]|uniref:copper resistance CopC family protein n=1 Tax=Gilvimarinus sp. DZF01 TaxID=3461371 RepID=UPI004045D1E4